MNRQTLVRCLLAHDEDELVERVPTVTDEQLRRIGSLASHYAFSPKLVKARRGSIGTTKAVTLATVDVLEGAPRDLRLDVGDRRGPAAEEDALVRLGLFAGPPGVAAEAERRAQRG